MVDYSSIPRDSRRVPLATKVQFKFDRFSGFISEYSANISPTGMYIVSSAPEPPGRILELEFRMGDGFEIIQGRGEVVWSRSVGDGPLRPPGMGIRFLEMSEGSKDLIYRIVDRYVQEGGIPFDLTSARDRNDEAPEAAPAASPESRASLEETVDAFPDLPPLDLEPAPFPDLDLDPVKDSSGVPLPWFSAAPGQEAPTLPTLTADPALHDEEPFELFPSIGPALEEVEQTFSGTAAGRSLPREEPPAPLSPPPLPPPVQTSPLAPPPLIFPAAVPAPVRTEAPAAAVSPQATTEVLPEPPAANDTFPPLTPPPAPALSDPFAAFEPVAALPETRPEPPPSGPGLFADYLPKTPNPPSSPARRPVASLAGAAAAQEPRRLTPWVLLGLLAVLGTAAFLLRDRIPGWLGLGGDEEAFVAQNPPRALPRRRETPSPGLGSDLTSELEAVAAASQEPPPPAPTAAAALPPTRLEPTPAPLPETVQRKPVVAEPAAASGPAAGPAATAVERITFEKTLGGTDIVLWGNGGFPPASYTSSRMGSPPRALIVVTGIRRPFPQPRITVGTGEARQVRIGYHGGDELHVVIDLAAPDVKVSGIVQDGQRLRIHLLKG
jgi:uncharacterized protein (TIGR02266 family)